MRSNAWWIVVSLLGLLPDMANGQPFRTYGIKGGMNIAALNSELDLDTSPRIGYHLGLYYRRGIGKDVSLRLEIFYSAEGQIYDSLSIGYPYTYVGVQSITTIHKLCTPVLFEVGNRFTVDVGGQIGWLLAADNTMARAPVNGSARRDMTDQLTTADLSFVCGVGFHPARSFEVCVRYNQGLSPVLLPFPQHSPNIKFRSRVLQFTIGYSF